MLPLKAGSILVVNASDIIVKTGQTNPSELIKLLKKGVKIYSCDKLHAKVFVVNQELFIGSSNVSRNSDLRLQEAMLHTSEVSLVKQAKLAVKDFCQVDLGMEQLKRLEQIYNPPKFIGGIPVDSDSKSRKSANNNSSKFYVCNLTYRYYPDGLEEALEEGKRKAENKVKNPSHRILDFRWTGKPPFKLGDTIMQIVKDDEKVKFIYPPGTVIGIHRSGTKGYFIFLEAPNRRKRRLASQGHKIAALVKRGGLKKTETATQLFGLWNS
ncbi:MAG: hypothetical protein EOO07_32595 [Chitinophagaceae bacterium]|nr:MAG: hypothetical protein EOO07_32595 [Chitinophagaceae bacterium]